MIINHNIASLNTYRQLSANSVNTQNSLAKLSSGLRINKAGDDAAGLAISEKMRSQIRGLGQAQRNAQDGISLIQTAEGALNETHSILQRMRELAVEASNDTNTDTDRKGIQQEIDQLTSEINRIGNTTEFNTRKLLNGDVEKGAGSVLSTTSAPVYSNSLTKVNISDDSAAGAYTATINNIGGKDTFDVGATQAPASGGNVATNNISGTDTGLAAGSYKIAVASEISTTADDITNDATGIADASDVMVSADAIADTNLTDANDYEIAINKTTTQTPTDIDGTNIGLSNLDLNNAAGDGTNPADGNYSIETKTGLTGVSEEGVTGIITDAIIKVTDVTIAADSTFLETGSAEIQLVANNAVVDNAGTGLNTVVTGLTASDITLSGTNMPASGQYTISTNGSGDITITSVSDNTKTATVANGSVNNAGVTAFNLANGGGTINIDTTGLAAAIQNNQSATITINPNSFTLKLVDNADAAGVTIASTTFNVSENAGVNSVTLGDLTVNLNYSGLYDSITNGDATSSKYDGAAIDFDTTKEIRITNTGTGDTSDWVDVTAGGNNIDFDLTDAATGLVDKGSFNLDVNTVAFDPGKSIIATVSSAASYTVQLMEEDGSGGWLALAGSSQQTLTSAQLSDPNEVNYVNLGNGVAVNLNAAALSIAADGDYNTTFTANEGNNTTAVLQDMSGNDLSTKYVISGTSSKDFSTSSSLSASTDDSDVGKVTFNYDGAVGTGDYIFTVEQNKTADDFQLTVNKDGHQIFQDDEIAINDMVDIGDGISIDTGAALSDSETATFTIELGTEDHSLNMQVGANIGQLFSVDVSDMRALALGISAESGTTTVDVEDSQGNTVKAQFKDDSTVTDGTSSEKSEFSLDVGDSVKSTAAVKVLDNAINKVSEERSKLGAFQNRLEHTINNLGTSSENLTAAESRIRDVDMAKEMMEFTKNNILSQAAQAMLAQANQQPQGVLQLLR